MMVDFDSALLALAGHALGAVALWAAVVATLGAWHPTARLARALTPRALRFLIVAGLSGAMSTAVTSTTAAQANDLHGLAPTGRITPAGTSSVPTWVVQPGDSLWRIAAANSDPGAAPAVVAQETRRWYQTNLAVVGSNPDLIVPGQRLLAPGPWS